MTKKEKLQHILETLDKIYGTTKDGFYHNQDDNAQRPEHGQTGG